MSKTKSKNLNIEELTVDDFATPAPYEYLYSLKDAPFDQDQALNRMQARAKEVKYTNFLRAWRSYEKQNQVKNTGISGQVTAFTDMKHWVLASGKWICTDEGIYTIGEKGEIIACPHPILITERFEDVESGEVKVKLAFKLGKVWREIMIERSVIASAQKIIQLADLGVGVTSESAKHLVSYLADLEALNFDYIPTKRSVSRLGWITDEIFSPYEPDIEFDGQHAFRQAYDATKPEGSFEKWRKCMMSCLQLDPVVQIVVAASFTSPLLKPLGALSNVIHLFATTSTGKTMILKMAASIWGDPTVGKLIKSFNATPYAVEQYAGFFNGIPALMDELQINREKYGGNKKVNLYQMTQGASGGRGRRDGGLRTESQWKLSFITSGEEPIASTFDAAGAHARMIEVHLDRQIIDLKTGMAVSSVIDRNYGHAGRRFIEGIKAIGREALIERHDAIIQELDALKIQPKQAMAASTILLGYELMNGLIFDGKAPPLMIDMLIPFLLTEDDLDPAKLAYEQVVEWVAANENRFNNHSNLEQLGELDDGFAYIIRSQFNKFIDSINMSPRSVLTGMADRGLIDVSTDGGKRRFDVQKWINGVNIRVVAMKLDGYEKKRKVETSLWQGF